MAALQKLALSPMDPNLPTRPLVRKRSTRATNPSPLRKQSDYQLVAPLKVTSTAASGPPLAPSSTANRKPSDDPKTPKVAAKDRKKKLLCATPPQVLQDTRGRAEYDRGRQLGEGGFARCFLVQNKEGELFAAKTVAKKSLQNQRMKAKFFGEIQVHKTMIHPNVVKFIECFEDNDNIYMILELCPNKSLMDMLRARKRFTEPETRFFLLQLLGALKYMHGKKVIHRDLKLGNIFLDADMNIKIGDFGLAALLVNENDRKRTICGTPNYIAPEVLFGSGKEGQGHSFEVDLWGVGVIMYAMLVGKPPFQAGDVNIIYQKIRHNTFSWPEEVPVSSAAKHLVHSILNHDPDARPTLDDIADHYFFKSGFFPRLIPISAGKQPPVWRGASGQGVGAVSTNRQDWIKNYEEVARECGIGVRSDGRPVSAVGDHAGESMELLTLPPSRPTSALSTGDENQQFAIEKQTAKMKLEDEAKKQKETDAYILPETLSPRDSHARMRGANALKAKASRLWGPTRGTGLVSAGLMPARQAPGLPTSQVAKVTEEVEERSDDDFEDQEEEKPIAKPAPQRLKAQPIRRSTVVTSPAARKSVFPSRNQAAKSHAAELRAASQPEVHEQSVKAPPPLMALRPQRIMQSRSSRPTSSASAKPQDELPPSSQESVISARSSSQPSSQPPSQPSEGPVIPFGPNLSSKIGVSIRSTATSAVLSSLRPFINNLDAFASSRLHILPPTPAVTIAAVKSSRRGESNKHVFITKWVDYTNKYGVAYILTDGTCTAMFNDNTSFVVDGIGGEKVEFITQSYASDSSQDTVYRRLQTEMEVLNEKKRTSKGLARKMQMWKRFKNYMKSDLETVEQWSVSRDSVIREPTVGGDDRGMLFVTHYTRLKRCALFRFSDGSFQLNFIDHTKLIVSSGGRTIRVITKSHELTVMSLEDIHQEVFISKNRALLDFGIREKLNYLTDILKLWAVEGKFPRSYDVKDETGITVLGE
ncbi:Pkinase-domain-containing protein [Choiromyces venosus 120613-1]|uniref:Serine/threonine-protein kinase n=1 Tax=Choiromyces venosus 120613-1 TaxID=1336337 RepID=A0A3N4J0P0_9PEZI|nr:Pkinase-domain-containing protein [Choiromyces venosus 120613-1]